MQKAFFYFIFLLRNNGGRNLKLATNDILTQLNQTFNRILDRAYLNKVSDKVDLVFLDIGARGGAHPIIELNRNAFKKIILVEGEEKEVESLRSRG